MQRVPLLLPHLARSAQPAVVRAFTTTFTSLSRGKRKTRYSPTPRASTSPAAYEVGQAGTDVGHASPAGQRAGGAGLFEEDKVAEITPDDIEKEMLASQATLRKEVDGNGERENLAGTDVGHGGGTIRKGTEKVVAAEGGVYGPEEVIYTTPQPYNTALMLTVAGVIGVFAFAMADFARVGVEWYDEETGEYRRAPAWKSVITRLTLRRSPTSLSYPYPFPRDSLVTLHHPLSPVLTKLGIKPQTVPFQHLNLLGALTDSKPYHPRIQHKPGRLESLLLRVFPSSPSSRNKPKPKGTHAPFVISGERLSRSLALKRAPAGEGAFSRKGAWCKDWDALERALLGVDEAQWTRK
ncbi:hypothetical protein JCM11641_004404 [Rhodosporidiobolus odoratus]